MRRLAANDTPLERRHRRLMRLLLIGLLLATLALGTAAAFISYFAVDLWFTREVQRITNPAFREVMIATSWVGYGLRVWLMALGAALLLWRLRWRHEAVCLLVSAGGGGLLSMLIKLAVARPRPAASLVNVYLLHPTNSFPSGHVVSYVTLFGFLFYVVYVRLARSWPRTLLLTLLAMPVALVGLSRVYLGAHWLSDVVGGYGLGALWLFVAVEAYWWLRARRATGPPKVAP